MIDWHLKVSHVDYRSKYKINRSNIPEAIRVGVVELSREFGEVGNAKGTGDGTRDGCEVLQDWRVGSGLSILEIGSNDEGTQGLDISVCDDDLRVGIRGGIDGKVIDCIVDSSCCLAGVDISTGTSPKITLGKGRKI